MIKDYLEVTKCEEDINKLNKEVTRLYMLTTLLFGLNLVQTFFKLF